MKLENTIEMNSLQRAVYGRNLINKLTIRNLKKVLPQIEKFTGKKIELANGSRSSKFWINTISDKINSEVNKHFFRSYIHFTGTRVVLSQDINIKDSEYGCIYFKNEVIIGKINLTGYLTEVDNLEVIKKSYKLIQYNPDKVKRTLDQIDNMKNEIRELETKVLPFTFKNF